MNQTESLLRSIYHKSLLTKKEAAKELSISVPTLDRMRQTGQIRSTKIGGQIRFKIPEIARYVEDELC